MTFLSERVNTEETSYSINWTKNLHISRPAGDRRSAEIKMKSAKKEYSRRKRAVKREFNLEAAGRSGDKIHPESSWCWHCDGGRVCGFFLSLSVSLSLVLLCLTHISVLSVSLRGMTESCSCPCRAEKVTVAFPSAPGQHRPTTALRLHFTRFCLQTRFSLGSGLIVLHLIYWLFNEEVRDSNQKTASCEQPKHLSNHHIQYC